MSIFGDFAFGAFCNFSQNWKTSIVLPSATAKGLGGFVKFISVNLDIIHPGTGSHSRQRQLTSGILGWMTEIGLVARTRTPTLPFQKHIKIFV